MWRRHARKSCRLSDESCTIVVASVLILVSIAVVLKPSAVTWFLTLVDSETSPLLDPSKLHFQLQTWRCPGIPKHLNQIHNRQKITCNFIQACHHIAIKSAQQAELLIETFVVLELLILYLNYFELA